VGRISLQDPTVAEPWLTGLLEADIPGRARPAFYAALALGTHTAFSPLGLILAQALENKGALDHAVEFDPLVPEQTVSLREVAVWTSRRILAFLSTQEDAQENRIERARLLSNLGVRLSDLGCREEALAAGQRAVEIREKLAAARPDAFLPDLARSLGTLGTCLAADVRLRDAVAAFAEGMRALGPAFTRLPQAFAPLMAGLVSEYVTHVKELGESPDMELLAPILAKFEEIKGNEEESRE
jgi:tetratricopeptide (TPR) repeat protein